MGAFSGCVARRVEKPFGKTLSNHLKIIPFAYDFKGKPDLLQT
jgi:hypothetical protein